MTAYWLNCEKCDKHFSFDEITKQRSINSYLYNVFFNSNCDQSLLVFECPECKGLIRITYDFPRREKINFKVKHIVYRTDDEIFFQMLWETYSIYKPNNPVYDFKYMLGNYAFGLNKPAIMAEEDLKGLIEIFNKKCHRFL